MAGVMPPIGVAGAGVGVAGREPLALEEGATAEEVERSTCGGVWRRHMEYQVVRPQHGLACWSYRPAANHFRARHCLRRHWPQSAKASLVSPALFGRKCGGEARHDADQQGIGRLGPELRRHLRHRDSNKSVEGREHSAH